MKTILVHITGASPYSQSKFYGKDKKQGESDDDHYQRTWRNHLHTDKDGLVFIPPTSLKNAISEAAKFMSISVPGKGKATYTKNFEAGVMVAKPTYLMAPDGKGKLARIHSDDVAHEKLFLPSDGRRGGGKRVMKYYPVFPLWEGDVEFIIVDETVLQRSVTSPDMTVFEVVLLGTGQYIGIGRFRPRNNGYYGRFDVSDLVIEETMAKAA